MKKTAFLLLLFFAALLQAHAQDDLLNGLDSGNTNAHEPVIATFKGTRLCNFQTVETVGRHTLDFRISHRFNDFSQGIRTLYGLDGPASLRLSLDYSFNGRFQFGIARTNINKIVDGSLKYRLLRQTKDNHMPLSVTLFGAAYVYTDKEGRFTIPSPLPEYFSNRLAYTSQVIVGRKFSSDLSLQIAPSWVHFNLVEHSSDANDIFALVGMGRYKFTHRMAVTAEYSYAFKPYISTGDYHNSLGLGLDIETGGHVFQLFFTNSFEIDEIQTIPFTTSSWFTRSESGRIISQARFGFNISRVFTL
jgi:hypothetical protein